MKRSHLHSWFRSAVSSPRWISPGSVATVRGPPSICPFTTPRRAILHFSVNEVVVRGRDTGGEHRFRDFCDKGRILKVADVSRSGNPIHPLRHACTKPVCHTAAGPAGLLCPKLLRVWARAPAKLVPIVPRVPHRGMLWQPPQRPSHRISSHILPNWQRVQGDGPCVLAHPLAFVGGRNKRSGRISRMRAGRRSRCRQAYGYSRISV